MGARKEEDSLGEVEVPEDAYYGSFTARARENFDLTGEVMHPEMVRAIAKIKEAAARANASMGLLDEDKADAIIQASQEVQEGEFDDQFVLGPLQAGAGTPFHMNANEVIANRATEILGGELGEYRVHPNDDVNMGQSSNNVVPTAARLAVLETAEELMEELESTEEVLESKAHEFAGVVKVGRTHLQDAVPVTVGQEFGAYAELCREGRRRIEDSLEEMRNVGLGGNAVGTGINNPEEFRERGVEELSDVSDRELEPAGNAFAATQSTTPFSQVAGALDSLTRDMMKVSDDLSFLSSGPVAGIGELELPEVEPGSSIMPGKVNPSIVEAFKMACMEVQGDLSVIEHAAEEGDLELNVNTPLVAHNLLSSLELLASAFTMLREKCLEGVEVDEERVEELFEGSTVTATALSPYIGYDRTAEAVHRALEEDREVREVVEEEGWMTEEEMDRVLDAEEMTGPGGVDQELKEKVRERLG